MGEEKFMGFYKEKTIRSYDKNTNFFSKKFEGLLDVMKRDAFGKFINLIPGNKILDLGCGSGDHASYFSQKGFDVTCVDLSEEMIKLCKEKKLNAFVMDIEDLKFNENSFDGIWVVTSLLHIPKLKIPKIVTKLSQILTNHGILHVCVKEGKGESLLKDKHDGSSERFFSFWQEEELINDFSNHFNLIESKKVPFGKTVFLEIFLRKK